MIAKKKVMLNVYERENLEGDVQTVNWAKRSQENKNKPQNEEITSNFLSSSKYYMEMLGVAGGV